MAKITIKIDWNSECVGCFDPIQVVARMRVVFPNLITNERDFLLETCKGIAELSSGEMGALKTAVKDLYGRGPIILFSIPQPDGSEVTGTAERYWMHVSSAKSFSKEFREKFLSYVNNLCMQKIEIKEDDCT